MFDKLKKILSNREIIIKIIVTFGLLLVFKVGTYIPIPLVSTTSIRQVIAGNDFLTVLNAFSGGGLSNFSILALGISPYISASIIIQLLTIAIPSLERLSKMGEEGKKKISLYTKICALVFCLFCVVFVS